MSVRKQTGGEMPGTAGRKPALVCGSWGGCQNPEVLSLRRQGHEHN